MKRPILETRRQVVLEVINAYPGGRECAAARLGYPLKKFDNHAYENAGHRPLSDAQLCQLEQVSGSHYLPDYVSALYDGFFTRIPDIEKLDNTELYTLSLEATAKGGQLNALIGDAIVDGIDNKELHRILTAHRQHLAALHTEVLAVIELHRKARP